MNAMKHIYIATMIIAAVISCLSAGFFAMAQKPDCAPYAETVFESSPLGRILTQGAPGKACHVSRDTGQTIARSKYTPTLTGEPSWKGDGRWQNPVTGTNTARMTHTLSMMRSEGSGMSCRGPVNGI